MRSSLPKHFTADMRAQLFSARPFTVPEIPVQTAAEFLRIVLVHGAVPFCQRSLRLSSIAIVRMSSWPARSRTALSGSRTEIERLIHNSRKSVAPIARSRATTALASAAKASSRTAPVAASTGLASTEMMTSTGVTKSVSQPIERRTQCRIELRLGIHVPGLPSLSVVDDPEYGLSVALQADRNQPPFLADEAGAHHR